MSPIAARKPVALSLGFQNVAAVGAPVQRRAGLKQVVFACFSEDVLGAYRAAGIGSC
jgi:hypothetical protein